MYRNDGCPDCLHVTSGDCGKHGPFVVRTSDQFVTIVSVVESQLEQARVEGRAEVLREVAKLNPYQYSATAHCCFCGQSAFIGHAHDCLFSLATGKESGQ